VNFGRQELEQTGSGHFACIGGFHPSSGRVLVLDTARFKYPPFWVEIEMLYNSINSQDMDSNKRRGFLVVSKKRENTPT
jgi:glutathione gamma-glutamylcysteinyltransferase